jgi:hypothetical protein
MLATCWLHQYVPDKSWHGVNSRELYQGPGTLFGVGKEIDNTFVLLPIFRNRYH